MKNICIVISLLPIFILASCDTREDVFENEKQNPVMNYVSTSNTEIFSYVKQVNMPYIVDINIADIGNVDFHVVGGNGDFTITSGMYNVGGSLLNFPTGNHQITFDSDSLGTYYFALKCFDRYGKVDSLSLNLEVFDNWIPTAGFTVNPQAGGFSFEYTFDSYGVDQDASFGGNVIRYIYTIDGMNLNDSLNVPQKTFNYVFPEAGNYNIKHWTMDNDSALSNPFIQSITIN